MEYFNEVLKLMPSEWEEATYTTNRFVLVDVKEDSEEFKSLINDLTCNSIMPGKAISVQRIQHPFAYARFMLHKEQIQKKCSLAVEQRDIVHINGDLSQVKTFIDYNCDERRKVFSLGDKYVVVKRVLNDYPERDTNWYPEYLIKLE